MSWAGRRVISVPSVTQPSNQHFSLRHQAHLVPSWWRVSPWLHSDETAQSELLLIRRIVNSLNCQDFCAISEWVWSKEGGKNQATSHLPSPLLTTCVLELEMRIGLETNLTANQGREIHYSINFKFCRSSFVNTRYSYPIYLSGFLSYAIFAGSFAACHHRLHFSKSKQKPHCGQRAERSATMAC